MDLHGKTILVTGAARRLGRSIALELGAAGASVVIHHHASAKEAESSAAVQRLGVSAHPVQAELSSAEGIASLFEGVDRLGDLHGLVNSAAVMVPGDLLKVTQADWDDTLNLNLKAAFFVLQQAALRLRRCGGGVIVNIADIAGLRPWPRFPVHSISKAGLLALTQVAALALAPDIRVNAVVPGRCSSPRFVVDAKGIDGLVNAIGGGVKRLAQGGRLIQTGFVRSYALAVFVGAVGVLVWVGWRL